MLVQRCCHIIGLILAAHDRVDDLLGDPVSRHPRDAGEHHHAPNKTPERHCRVLARLRILLGSRHIAELARQPVGHAQAILFEEANDLGGVVLQVSRPVGIRIVEVAVPCDLAREFRGVRMLHTRSASEPVCRQVRRHAVVILHRVEEKARSLGKGRIRPVADRAALTARGQHRRIVVAENAHVGGLIMRAAFIAPERVTEGPVGLGPLSRGAREFFGSAQPVEVLGEHWSRQHGVL